MSGPSNEERNLATARRFLEAIESGAAGEGIDRFLHPDIVHETLPNRISPVTVRSDLAGMKTGWEKGKRLMASQRYQVRSAVATREQVALEVHWTGTLAQAFGELPAGSIMRAHLAMFMEFRDGRIVALRNYDCYEPS
jgi:ketosteroid isomerase-like protein